MSKPPSTRKTAPSTEVSEETSIEEVIERQIGDIVPQKQRDVIVARMTTLMVSEHFSGPIPHPKHVQGYENIEPGSANRIISMAEKQQDHHIEMEKSVIAAEKEDRKLGMWLGAGTFALLIICALVSVLISDSELIPGLFLGTAAIGGVGLFVKGRSNGR